MKNQLIKLFLLIIFTPLFIACDDEETTKWQGDITDVLRAELLAGNDITIPEGIYTVSETIVQDGYCGTIKGAGKGLTILEAKDGFKSVDFDDQPGTKITAFFLINDAPCDVTFSDMTFNIIGEAPAELHNNPFAQNRITMDNVIVVSGNTENAITVTYKNLEINGEPSTDARAAHGKNLMWPLIAFASDDAARKAVDLLIENCEVNHAGQIAFEYLQAGGGKGTITNNKVNDSYRGVWLGWNMTDMEVDVTNNEFSNISDYVIENKYGAKCCFMNNIEDGVAMDDDCPQ